MRKLDYEDEIDNRQFAMFWDSLDITSGFRSFLILFIIRYAFLVSQVHLMKHPDEI